MSAAWSVFADICTGIWRLYCIALLLFIGCLVAGGVRDWRKQRADRQAVRRAIREWTSPRLTPAQQGECDRLLELYRLPDAEEHQ